MRLTIRPLTPDLWPALKDLFGDNGACNGCWCMYWRMMHVPWIISATASQRNHMIAHVAGAGAAFLACGWAGMFILNSALAAVDRW